MGNITKLTRNGHRDVSALSFGLMDDLTYSYQGNRLQAVDDAIGASAVTGFRDGAEATTEYWYDGNGNMTRDDNKDIVNISYNHLNLPMQVTVMGSNAGTLDYIYAADRTKLQKVNSNGTTTDYVGNFVYEGGNLKQITHPEGYVEPDEQGGYNYVYRYIDVWGNTRLTYSDDNNDGNIDPATEILREQNYYPFGLQHKGYNSNISGVKNDLKTYQGQEFIEDLGLNTHEWKYRMSDPSIGRFWQVDPLAKDYVYNSTYAFQENKLGMGIELEGAELLGQQFAQDLIIRASQFFGGSDKMVTGGSNMLNDAMSGNMAAREIQNNTQSNEVQGLQIDTNFEVVLEGAAQVDQALPGKQDLRNTADAAELTGDLMVVSSVATGPAAPAVAGTGEIISTLGTGTNITMDLLEGDVRSAAKRTIIEGISFGLSSLARQSPHVNEFAESVIDSHILFYEQVVVPKIDKKVQEKKE